MSRIVKAAAAAAAAATGALVGWSASALSLQDGAQPAEFPPASFAEDVYVDSRGCVYIRAGFGDSVTWVPRVTRQREVVCGAAPTFGGAAPPVVAAPVPAAPDPLAAPEPAPAPAVAAAPPPVDDAPPPAAAAAPVVATPPREVAPLPAPAAAPVVASAEIAGTIRVTCPADYRPGQTVVAEGLRIPLRCNAGRETSYVGQKADGTRYRIIAAPPPARVAEPDPVIAAVAAEALAGCTGASAVSQAYINSGGGLAVRCGPQQQDPLGLGRAASSGVVVMSPSGVVVPAPVIPDGYRPAWDDGRLNPYRGEGYRAVVVSDGMVLTWSQTTPRRLYDTTTGHDVTALFPRLRYPDLPTPAQLSAAIGDMVVSSKSAPDPVPAAAPVQATGHSYVQVGTFGVPANAENTIRLVARLGLPAAVINTRAGGRELKVVLAGPFDGAGDLEAALQKVRGAGFADAFTRR